MNKTGLRAVAGVALFPPIVTGYFLVASGGDELALALALWLGFPGAMLAMLMFWLAR